MLCLVSLTQKISEISALSNVPKLSRVLTSLGESPGTVAQAKYPEFFTAAPSSGPRRHSLSLFPVVDET